MTNAVEPGKRKNRRSLAPVEHDGSKGRPHYSDAVRQKLLTALRSGQRRNAAAALAGVHRDTFYDWIGKDEELKAAVEQAEDEAEGRYANTIGEIRRDSDAPAGVRLKAAGFWLERRRPDGWRGQTSVEITAPPEVQEARSRELDDLRSELRALGEELLRRGTDPSHKARPGGG
jgi:hypothetical protein